MSVNSTVNLDDRPDYMLEAFLDEQHILTKPLFIRRLALLATLETKSQSLEFKLKRANSKDSPSIQEELLALAEEKIMVSKQIQDLAHRQMESLLDVENALESAARREREDADIKAEAAANRQNASGSKAKQSGSTQFSEEEIWCICRKPDDGRAMVACDNEMKCPYFWWHLDCVDRYIATKGVGSMPDDNIQWFCPLCETANRRAANK